MLFAALGFSLGLILSKTLYAFCFLIFPLLFLFDPYLKRSSILWQTTSFFLLASMGFAYMQMEEAPPFSDPKEITGSFEVNKIEMKKEFFRKTRRYKGVLSFSLDGKSYSLPVTAYMGKKWATKKSYWVKGTLFPRKGRAFFRADFFGEKDHSVSLAYKRYQWKKHFSFWLTKKFQNKEVAELIFALTSGISPSPFMRYQFQKLGLSHILAISGFHFGLIAFFLLFLLRLFSSRILSVLLLLIFSSSYLFYLGFSPSVVRAYLFLFFYSIANLLQRKTRPLNILGAALLMQLAAEPQEIFSLSLQLSFLACIGIFCLFPSISELLSSFFPWDKKRRWLGRVISYLRSTAALTLSVQITLLPIIFYHFHIFPLLSLIYNLFIPFLISLGMGSFLLGFLLFPVQKILFLFTSFFTYLSLHLIYSHPVVLEYEVTFLQMNNLVYAISFFLIFLFYPLFAYRKIDSCNFVPV